MWDAQAAVASSELARHGTRLTSTRPVLFGTHLFLSGPASECSSLESESAKLSELESGFWREYEEYALQLQQLTDEQAHVKNQIKNASDTLDRSVPVGEKWRGSGIEAWEEGRQCGCGCSRALLRLLHSRAPSLSPFVPFASGAA